jgi:hypothetical protein
LGIKEIKELIEKIKNGQVNDTKATDSIAQAEEWQKDGYQVACIADGQILMKKELEKILFGEKLQHDREFRKKVLEDHCYSQADLYKIPKEDDHS